MDELLDDAPIGVVRTDTDGTVTDANAAAATLLDAAVSDLVGTPITESFPRSASGSLRAAFEAGPTDDDVEEYYPTVDRWLAVRIRAGGDGAVVYVRDRSDHHDAEQTIDRLRRRLDRVESIDLLVAAVLGTVIDAGDRTAVARTLCDRLGGEEGYAFVWVGERDTTGDGLDVLAAGGDEAARLREAIADAKNEDGRLPERGAVDSGDPVVVERLADEETIPRSVRLAAFGGGLQSATAVPLAHRDTVHGVLGVYTDNEDGLSDPEQSSLSTLGEVAGFAITATRQEGLLFADTLTELTLDVRGEVVPLSVAADDDRTLTLSGVVPREDGSAVCYVRVEGPAERAAETLSSHPSVEAVRVVGETASALEVELGEETPLATVAAWGGTVEHARFEADGGEVSVVVPADENPRRLLDALGETATVDVLAKTERAANPETVQGFRSEFEDRLTDRQRQVLRTAYLADYFQSPRGSSAEEVADALGITGPTVLHHLRNAQRALLAAFFELERE